MSLASLFDELEEQRREAYVRAVLRASEENDVVGYIGDQVPVELFHALGLMALPVQAVDGDILKFSTETRLCPVIDATLTYARTDRCPLIHSSRLIVVDNGCPIMAWEIAGLSPGKDVALYAAERPGAFGELMDRLEKTYGRRLMPGALEAAVSDSKRLSGLLDRLKYHSDLGGREVFILEYYLNFLPMPERLRILQCVSEAAAFSDTPVDFVPVRVQSGAGIYRQIDRRFAGANYRIIEEGCRHGRRRYDYVYSLCPFGRGTEIGYEVSPFEGG